MQSSEVSLRETPEVLGEPGSRLRGMLHWPTASARGEGLVCCYPFGEERKCSARVMTLAARRLCQHGYHVLRFDYSGTGESDGSMERAAVSRWLAEIHAAREHLAARAGIARMGLLGVRFGATLAAIYDRAPVSSLLLWAPLQSGAECLEEARRHLAATRLLAGEAGTSAVEAGEDMGGFRLSGPLRAEMEVVQLPEIARMAADRTVVVRFSAVTADRPAENVATVHGSASVLSMRARPFWMTASRFDPAELADRTVRALQESPSA